MNFDYSDDQKYLRDEAAKFLAGTCTIERIRAVLDAAGTAQDDDLWRAIVAMGWPGMCIPESFGGLGMDPVDLCAIAERIGAALAPVPFSSTVYLFAEAIMLAGSEDQKARLLPGIVTGDVTGCVAAAEGPGSPFATTPATVVVNDEISGSKLPVTDGGTASHALVLATAEGAPALFVVALGEGGVARTTLRTLDPTRNSARLDFTAAPCERLGGVGEGLTLLQRIHDRAAVYLAFEQIGGADQTLEMARDYALERHAFGRPIGGYQAIKHRLADMYIRNQLARSNAYYGAWALRGDNPILARAAAAARVAASEAYWFASKECIEIFGGIGTTWEADCHLHYRRAKQLALMVGGTAAWRERLVCELEREAAEQIDGL